MYLRNRQGSASQSAIDGESLQADVMRFMAIIGFCLVAIMALVREVSPPVNAQAKVLVDAPVLAPVELPVETPLEMVAVVVAPNPEPQALAEPETQVAAVLQVPTSAAQAAEQSEPEQSESKQSEPEQSEPVPSEPGEGLSLRFHSDRDFLRLITSGDVGLYLFNDNNAFKLAKNFGFQSAAAPNQLYEVMAQTIPAAISAAAKAVVAHPADFKWGVAMPARIEQRIASLVATESSGQLVVDRRGDVRHEASAVRGGQDS